MANQTTSQTLNEALESFEAMVKELIELGYSVDMAVQIAYKDFPIMEMLEAPLQANLVHNFKRGFHSVLIPKRAKRNKMPYSTKAISLAMQKSWTHDKLTLSERLHGKSPQVRKDVAAEIKKAIKQGKSNIETARAIFDGYGYGAKIPLAKLPEVVNKVKSLKRPKWNDEEGQQAFERTIRQAARKVEQNTTPSLRAAYSDVIRAVEDGNTIDLNRAIQVAVQEKARYHAERIARTENARAYADGQMSRYMNDPDVVALKWKLGSRHPRYDICDFYANADLYGLGKGVYPKDKFPRLPAHPHCMCLCHPVYDFEVDIDAAHENIEKGGKAYIDTLSEQHQEQLLGVEGRKLVAKGKTSWTTLARGWNDEPFQLREPDKKSNI